MQDSATVAWPAPICDRVLGSEVRVLPASAQPLVET